MLFFEMRVIASTRDDLWFQHYHMPITHRPLLNWKTSQMNQANKAIEELRVCWDCQRENEYFCYKRIILSQYPFYTVLVEVLFH